MNKDLFVQATTQRSRRNLLKSIDSVMDDLRFGEKIKLPVGTIPGRMFYRKSSDGGICIVEYAIWSFGPEQRPTQITIGSDYLGNVVHADYRLSAQAMCSDTVKQLYQKIIGIPQTKCFFGDLLEIYSGGL
jgi:hypothetical protein